jgi:hypothetical protein
MAAAGVATGKRLQKTWLLGIVTEIGRKMFHAVDNLGANTSVKPNWR